MLGRPHWNTSSVAVKHASASVISTFPMLSTLPCMYGSHPITAHRCRTGTVVLDGHMSCKLWCAGQQLLLHSTAEVQCKLWFVQASMSTNAARSKLDTPKSKSAREKALEFARSVPRPEMKRAASSGSSSGENTPKQQRQSSGLTEIEKLQAQHALHRQKVESIRQEFVRMGAS